MVGFTTSSEPFGSTRVPAAWSPALDWTRQISLPALNCKFVMVSTQWPCNETMSAEVPAAVGEQSIAADADAATDRKQGSKAKCDCWRNEGVFMWRRRHGPVHDPLGSTANSRSSRLATHRDIPLCGGLALSSMHVSFGCNNRPPIPPMWVPGRGHGMRKFSTASKFREPSVQFKESSSTRNASRSAARCAAVLALVLGTAATQAQTVMVYEDGQSPSAQDVADILSRGASENTRLRGQAPHNGRSPF